MLSLILLASLFARDGPPPGFGYDLSCSLANKPTSCVPESSLDHHHVDHFELSDENGKVQFQQNAPKGKTFRMVRAQFEGPGGFTGLDIHWGSFDSATQTRIARNISSARLLRIIANLDADSKDSVVSTLEITPSGLVPSTPVLCPYAGDISTAAGAGVECSIETTYFRFSAELRHDFNQHDETLLSTLFTIFPASREYDPKALQESAELTVYADHRMTETSSETTAQAGMFVTWQEQSVPNQRPKPTPAKSVEIMAAWASLKLVPGSGQFAGLQVASYDKNDLWLRVNLNGTEGWIRGDRSFRAVGLP